MAYSKRNKLLQMKQVIDCYLEHKTDGNTTAYVYRTHIWPRYHISIATLYNYLATPVDKLLKEEIERRQKAEQMKLF